MVTFPSFFFFFPHRKSFKGNKIFFFFLEDLKKPRSGGKAGGEELGLAWSRRKGQKTHKKSTFFTSFFTFFTFSSFLFPSSLPSWQPGFGKAELRTHQDNKSQTQRVFLFYFFVPLHLYKVVKCHFFSAVLVTRWFVHLYPEFGFVLFHQTCEYSIKMRLILQPSLPSVSKFYLGYFYFFIFRFLFRILASGGKYEGNFWFGGKAFRARWKL